MTISRPSSLAPSARPGILDAEIAGSEDRDHRFLSLFGEHGDFDFAVLNVKYRIRAPRRSRS
jgi:hypothetical protein